MDRNLIENVQKLRKEGKSFGNIAKELLITKSKACYCSKINLDKYDEKMLSHQKYVDKVCELGTKCTNINQILRILGKKGTNEYYKQVRKILIDNNIDTSHFIENEKYIPAQFFDKKPLEEYLVSGSTMSSTKVRNRLLKEKIKEHRCERCKNTKWEGQAIPLQLHHINGNRNDNRLENLQLLCPNCHTLTDNYCGKNIKKIVVKHCKLCGKEIKKTSTYCEECFHSKVQAKNTQVVKPSKLELINDFKEFGSFRGICKKYLVGHKKVEEWFESYGMPSSSLKVRAYIREIFGEDFKWKFTSGNSKVLREYQKKNFKQIELLNSDNSVEKTYSSIEEIVNDGFDPKSVYRVCRGELKTHHKKMFRFESYTSNKN